MEDARDVELVKRFQGGDEQAFNELVLVYQKRVYQVALKMVRNHHDAQDVAQDVFVRAYSALKQFKGESTLFTWLYRVTVNRCINLMRKEKVKEWIPIFDLVDVLRSKSNPAEEFARGELGRRIDEGVLKLPPRQRAVFVLRHYQNLPHAEIARMFGRSEGAIKANYFQAVAKLRKYLTAAGAIKTEGLSVVRAK